MKITATELGHDVLVDDPVGDGVRERPFEAVTDFDPHLPVLQSDQEQRAVVDTLAAQLPRLRHPERVLLDRLRLGSGDDEHGDLAALRLFESAELGFERSDLVRRQRPGEVGDRRSQRRHRHKLLRRCQGGHRQQGDGDQARRQRRNPPVQPGDHESAPPAEERRRPQVDGAGSGAGAGWAGGVGVPKSTVGGFEIAASFSTVKFGLTL